ncbi:MAG: ATP-dependent DNA ligase [Nitrososphaerota archaeon]|nr:ATP-dependent DNA ligase [Candidatus Bathyarchaeota archaeon]MDW8023120.1 ATP-dependent DNA ligase [Nitrososphaerota archaeon]
MPTPFKALAELCEKLEATTKRTSMISLVANFLEKLEPSEVEPAVLMLLGRPFPKGSHQVLEVSWATLSEIIKRLTGVDWKFFMEAFSKTGDVGSAARHVFENSKVKRQASLFGKTLTIMDVRQNFEAIAETTGYGSRERKERLIEALLSLASPIEVKYLVKIFIGEMRTGFYEGLMEQAVSKAFQISLETVQRASMILGDVGAVAAIAKVEGKEALLKVGFKLFRPVKPMLAQMANDVAEALREHGGKTAFEYKLDGARVQIHRKGDNVRIFSRRLTDVTASLPDIVNFVLERVRAEEAILEGEVIAVDLEGHPIPFQHLMRRFRRIRAVEDLAKAIPVKLYLFDILHLNGESLISLTYTQRRKILAEIVGEANLTKQIITDNSQEAEAFLREAINGGHEGLMAKKLDGEYAPGIRGKRWLKIKPTLEPLDLVIVAAEYGYGRRHEWLSNYYLAARDAETGRFLTVGKTFKGLTDSEIMEMTRRLKELTIKEEPRRVVVAPKIVVEVAYNEIQKSPKYKCGMALRFARITRIRDDKQPEEADTIQLVREIYERQFHKKGYIKLENSK